MQASNKTYVACAHSCMKKESDTRASCTIGPIEAPNRGLKCIRLLLRSLTSYPVDFRLRVLVFTCAFGSHVSDRDIGSILGLVQKCLYYASNPAPMS